MKNKNFSTASDAPGIVESRSSEALLAVMFGFVLDSVAVARVGSEAAGYARAGGRAGKQGRNVWQIRPLPQVLGHSKGRAAGGGA